ncbi:MAG TPA: Nif3-like dinuclear metal center hexameric protein [Bacteroidota bacterium]
MKVRDVLGCLEAWAPPALAWEKDVVGLQCGDPDAVTRSILVALDPTEEVVLEAVRRRADLVVTHHPLLFRPVQRIDLGDSRGRILRALLAHRISLVAAHTNLDFAPGGTSHVLAEALGLAEPEFLHTPFRLERKVVTFVPAAHAERVAAAMGEAGAGIIGRYDRCSFRSDGVGTFRGNAEAHPAVGTAGVYERVPEIRLEMVAPAWRLDRVLRALRGAHPYEEPAVDVYSLETPQRGYGMGVIGTLPRPVGVGAFLRRVKRVLGVPALRCTSFKDHPVRRIAVCGGSGADLTPEAVRRGAEVFVTADVRYHAFHDAAGSIVLVDAGHFETERPVAWALAARLRSEIRSRRWTAAVTTAAVSTNPVRYV